MIKEYTIQLEICGVRAKHQEEAVEQFWKMVEEDRNLLSTIVWETDE